MPFRTRTTTTATLALALTLALAGCSPGEGDDGAEPAPSSSPSSAGGDPSATGVPTTVPGLEESTRSPKPRPSADPSGSEMPSVEAIEEATLSPRGYLEKEIDEIGGILLMEPDILSLRIWLRGVTWDPPCADGSTPSHGRFVALDFEVETTEFYDAELESFTITPAQFVFFDAADASSPAQGAAAGCVPSAQRLPELAPEQLAEGRVILDVPHGTAVVAFEPYSLAGSGWEYPLP